jgi:sugar lactone lactonase YvrE
MKSLRVGLLLLVVFLLAIEWPAVSQSDGPFPTRIDLPDGFGPEGIEISGGHTFYVGSIPTGDIYRGDLRTGEGGILDTPGGNATGLESHQGRLFVAGGETGQARVIDASSGAVLKTYQLTQQQAFINDVVIASGFAYFTDSVNPVLYRVPTDLGPAQTIPLTGDLQYQSGFNVNGIEATPNSKTLILVQSNTGMLFTADPETGSTKLIDLGGDNVQNGDGILLSGGRTLYVVQNFLNQVAVVELSPDLSSGRVTQEITNSGFDIPTTIDQFGNRLYAVNARFTTDPNSEPPPDYWLTGFSRR